MGKDSGRGNERLDAKATAVYHVAEREGGGSKIPPETPACVSLSKSHESKALSTRIRIFLNPQLFLSGFKNFPVHM